MSVKIYCDQIWILAKASMKARYRSSLSGFLWVIMNPVILYGAQCFVFGTVLKVDIPQLYYYLFLGLLPWIFISQSIQMSSSLIVNSGVVLKSFNIHPLVMTTAQVLDNFVNMLVLFFLLTVIFFLFGQQAGSWLRLIPAMILLLAFVTSLSFLVSIVNVFFRDMTYIASFLLNVSFYLTPIFYSEQMINPRYHWILDLNFIYKVIRPFQIHTQSSNAEFFESILKCFLVVIVCMALSYLMWRKKRNGVYNAL